jgi:NAD+ kinase
MKVAIFGQYYQNDTRPIIKDIFVFFNRNNVELVIEEKFLKILYEEKIVERQYNTYSSYTDLDSSFDILISIGGDGTILRATTFVRDSGIPILGVNAGRLGFLAKVQKENIESFLQIVLEKSYTISERTLLAIETSPSIAEIDINFAMNEVAVSRKDTTSMITIETFFKWRIFEFLLG